MSESNGEATTPATTAATVDPAPPEEFVKAAKVAQLTPAGLAEALRAERAEAVQAEAVEAEATSAGAREEREERGGQA
ncbi:hypothetical protein [Streptomyces milbemycinicus]|uniref:hypothetical protein n=1 Tax=Streptomyces milbemycinicus TaxID=476552 RepID=UPI0033E656BE